MADMALPSFEESRTFTTTIQRTNDKDILEKATDK